MTYYHTTNNERLDSILINGLKTGQEGNLTYEGKWSDDIYGCRPIFLAMNDNWIRADNVTFIVDVSELTLLPDLPSLVDHGAYVEEDHVWFEEGSLPIGWPDRNIYFDELLSDLNMIDMCINLTNSAVVLTCIEPKRLRIIEEESVSD